MSQYKLLIREVGQLKRRVIYIFPAVLIILVAALFMNSQGNKKILEDPEREASAAVTANSSELPVSIADSSGQSPIRYLTAVYDVDVKRDIFYASKPNETEREETLKFDLYQPAGDSNKRRPVFIYLHGGGYSAGTKDDGEAFSMGLAKRGYPVLSIDYRLKKEPMINFSRALSDASEDIADVIGWISSNAEAYGLDAGRLIIGGDSAGGNLSERNP